MPAADTLVLFRRPRAGLRKPELEQFARTLRELVAGGHEFRCLITNDRELQRLNLQFRGKDYPTDVLSFPEAEATASLGDIAISADRAADQARAFGHAWDQEIHILMLHGVLHLMGMDHETDRGRMRRAESAWRRRLGLPEGLIERVRA